MAPAETSDEREERVARLWGSLDSRKEGHIDAAGLKKGLKKIDHPLKNADEMLQNILCQVDTNRDGKIDFSEFRSFINRTESDLCQMFHAIDHDKNGEIDKSELRSAFAQSGVTVSNANLDKFFAEVDKNNDGAISYNEWRDFLLFLPLQSPTDFHALLSYYSATGNLNPEGDVQINDLHDLGTHSSLLIHFLLIIERLLYNTFSPQILFPSAFAHNNVSMSSSTCRSDMTVCDAEFDVEWIPIPKTLALWMSIRSYARKLADNSPQLGYFAAGGIAGVVSRTATAPLDRLKVYLIAQTGYKRTAAHAAKDGYPLVATKSLVIALKELWKAGGIKSLFAGNGLNVCKVMPESAIKFGAYESAKRAFARLEGHNDTKRLLPTSQFLAGGIGGMVAQCFVYPLDTLKFRMQCETVAGGLTGNKLIAETARKVWNATGFCGFFRGLPLGLVGMFPYAAIDLSTFEYLKRAFIAREARKLNCHENDVPLNNYATGAIGALSGGMSASVVYPMNVIRTRLQAQGTVLHPVTYTGIGDVARKTLASEGPRGFYKGLTPNLLKVAPAVSISYVVYENTKRLFGLT
ncbi:hypothetical protein N7495_005420 [Penicillium taxi]|uniref:uncharacterized protein n=1 Tax=Penicillium taxi TaxID=168475 RepID=UPI00254546C4|nr:uncharacterized protein N7495_005420 [Penicillium taxi]KAJ5893729.1 hypothetical protein N7495_005420 [Penicillium taxi]